MTQRFSIAALLAVAAEANYWSGEIRTNETFLYGRFKTRIQGDAKPGTVTSFFTFWGGDDQEPWSQAGWNEIDIEIVPSVTANPFFTNIIYAYQQQDGYYHPNFDPATDWHEYTVEWTPDYIAWSLNGTEVRRSTGTTSQQDINKRQNLFMNFWTPEFSPWQDNRDDSSMPWFARYDFVEYESYDTATQQFTFEWRDDFDSLDETRWRRSDGWSFESNSSTFVKPHVYVEDGALVLKMNTTKDDPPVDNTEYLYIKPCSGNQDRSRCSDCSPSQECFWSYPSDDPLKWKSDGAACRCLPRQRQADGYKYRNKNITKTQNGTCDGCAECSISVPKDDPRGWKSPEKMARCRAPPAQELTIIGSCGAMYDMGCGADCYWCVWSWPTAEGDGPNSACRCHPDTIIETNWGEPCDTLNAGQCGGYCRECLWSWKASDAAGADSPDATCRCKNWWG